jgi:AcrR family transcriptional regulator
LIERTDSLKIGGKIMAAKKKEDGKDTKQRIFDAARHLIARKGYAAVSVREIAKMANANISMLNYYFGGKVGILRAILDEFYKKYYSAVLDVDIKQLSSEEVIAQVIENLVRFYHENTELCVASHNAYAIDMPEIADLEMQWVKSRRTQIDAHFVKFGLDTSDKVTMTVMRGLLSAIISSHFLTMYAWEYTKESRKVDEKEVEEFVEGETANILDEAFYAEYSKILTKFYLTGIYGLTGNTKILES